MDYHEPDSLHFVDQSLRWQEAEPGQNTQRPSYRDHRPQNPCRTRKAGCAGHEDAARFEHRVDLRDDLYPVAQKMQDREPQNGVIPWLGRHVLNRGDLERTGANLISVDWTSSLADFRRQLRPGIGVQGNIDPSFLLTTPEVIAAETQRILESMRDLPGHIFNLGHGVMPEAKLDCIESLLTTVRNFRGNATK